MVTGGWFMTLLYPHEFKVRLRKVTVNPPPMSSNMSGRNRKSHLEKWRFIARKIHQPKNNADFPLPHGNESIPVDTIPWGYTSIHNFDVHQDAGVWPIFMAGSIHMAWLLKMLNPRKITWIHVPNELPFNYPYLVAHSTAYKWVSSPQFFEWMNPLQKSHENPLDGPNAGNSHWKSCDLIWLVVGPPLWKIWVRQSGWWNSQYMESDKSHVPNHQPVMIYPPTKSWSPLKIPWKIPWRQGTSTA